MSMNLQGLGGLKGLSHTLSKSGFNLDAYLASLQTGFRLNTRKTDRFFQEATGPTLADDVGEAAALALDSETWGGKTLAQVLAAQPEVNPNPGGPFTAAAGWSGSNATVSVVGGKLRVQSAVSGVNARVADLVLSGLIVGATYAFRALGGALGGAGTLVSSAVALRNNANTVQIGSGNADGNWVYFQATEANNRVRLRWDGNASTDATSYVDFDYAMVRLVPGFNFIQTGASTLRPQRQATGFKFDALDDNWLSNYLPRVDQAAALAINGGFDTDTLWSKGTGWSISGGVATKAAGTASNLGSTFGALTAGKLYACTYTLTRSAGSAVFFIGANVGPTRSASGTYTDIILSPGAGFGIYGDAAFAGTIDNVVVREITNQTQFFAALVEVPASITANQVVVGSDTTTNTRLYVGFNSGGSLLYAVGNNAYSHIVDYRGQTVFVMLAFDGTTVRLFVNDQLVATQVQAGAPNPATPVRIGAANQNGSPSTYFGGVLIDTCAGADFPDLPRALQVRSAMLAGL